MPLSGSFRPFRLDLRRQACTQKTKIAQKMSDAAYKAVLPELIFVQSRQTPQRILDVFARVLTRHRLNPICQNRLGFKSRQPKLSAVNPKQNLPEKKWAYLKSRIGCQAKQKNTHATSKNNKFFPASENHPSDFRFITPLKTSWFLITACKKRQDIDAKNRPSRKKSVAFSHWIMYTV